MARHRVAIPATRRSIGGPHVAHCTTPDVVEPAHRRIAKAGRRGWLQRSNWKRTPTGTRVPSARMRACARSGDFVKQRYRRRKEMEFVDSDFAEALYGN